MTPEELLLKAVDAITEHGHLKRDLGRPGEGFCAMGAIAYAKNGMGDMSSYPSAAGHKEYPFKEATELLAMQIDTTLIDRAWRDTAWGTVVAWNNAPETTAEDVVLAMKKAATECSDG